MLADLSARITRKFSFGNISGVNKTGSNSGRNNKSSAADLKLADKVYKQTALHWAVLYGDLESARMLLDAGAFHSPVDKKGQTPLDIALDRNKAQIAELLDKLGAVSGKDAAEGRAAIEAKFAAENAEEYQRQQAIAASEALKPDFTSRLKTKEYSTLGAIPLQ